MTPTPEQKACCDALAGARPGDTIAVHAFAGTGKTTTLQLMSQAARKGKRILYLAYNKALADEGKRKFGPNVQCMTTHSLAFRNVRHFDFIEDVKANLVAPELGVGIVDAAIAIGTLKQFFASDYPQVCVECVPDYADKPKLQKRSKENPERYVELADKLWNRCLDNEDAVPMPHDGYLKLFQLCKKPLPYDIILFDEAQDANPATLDIIKRQNAVKVFVGDPHQQIYGFRGSINAMENLDAKVSLNLTTSFRFNQEVADMAALVLSRHKNVQVELKGLGGFRGDETEAGMCRTNAGVFMRALQAFEDKLDFGFIGSHPKDYVSDAMDVFRLRCNQLTSIRKDHIAAFETYGALESYIDETEDPELKTLVGAVNKLNTKLPMIVDELLREANPRALCKVGTGHASKGLEFDSVEIDSDFASFAQFSLDRQYSIPQAGAAPGLEDYTLAPEEANLLYVSITRARVVPSLGAEVNKLVYGRDYLKHGGTKEEAAGFVQALRDSGPEE